jgi:para-aminobenzoate synthetase/4-amino-4-deoxychorismate lyase
MPQEPFILLEDTKSHAPGTRGYLYTAPEFIIECRAPGDLSAALERTGDAARKGYHLAGWMAYECAYALEDKLLKLMPARQETPLLWFGAFTGRRAMEYSDLSRFWQQATRAAIPTHAITNQRLSIDKGQYFEAIADILDYLGAGDIYQVNYTLKNLFDFEGDTASLYSLLRAAQPVEFSAYIKMGDETILSFSPELFMRREGAKLFTKPMKGTERRGFLLEDDLIRREELANDEKSRAENLMILDLLRNDLSRLARPGTVKTTAKFEVEAFRSLLQMTSSVEAEIAPETSFGDIIRALFPCGSVTGAPKIRACEIIRKLEEHPRGVYTGAIGYITPDNDFCFNVPIRTIRIAGSDRDEGRRAGEMGIGGGIVADSKPEAEFQECLLKAQFATHPLPAFDLIETFLWQPAGGFRHLDDHLERLENSARFFDFSIDKTEIVGALQNHAQSLAPSDWRVRLLLSPEGNISITSTRLERDTFMNAVRPELVEGYRRNWANMLRQAQHERHGSVRSYDALASAALPSVMLSPQRMSRDNILLYHKTTRREVYDSEFTRLTKETGCFEVIFANDKGQVTEGSRSNIFIEKDGRLLTPALNAGLLPGICRKHMLQDKIRPAREAAVTLNDLNTAEKIFVGNSLRGLVEVRLLAP